jgi:hypothetical protein
VLNGELVVLDATAGELIFIDPIRQVELRRVTSAIPLDGGLVGSGSRGTLFGVNSTSQIVELNPASGAVLATLASPGSSLVGLAYINNELLVSDNAGVVRRLDPVTGTVLGTLAVPVGLAALGADGNGGVAVAAGGDYQPFVMTTLNDESSQSITEGVGPYAGSYRPVEPLSIFDGTNTLGAWSLLVQDTASGNVGVLHDWKLLINQKQDTPPDAQQVGFIGDSLTTAAAANDVDLYRFDVLLTPAWGYMLPCVCLMLKVTR